MIATMISAGTPVRACTRISSSRCVARNARPPSIRAWLMNIGRYSFHGLTCSAGRDIAATIASLNCAFASVASICSGSRPYLDAVSRTKLARATSNGTGVRSSGGAATASGAAPAGGDARGVVCGNALACGGDGGVLGWVAHATKPSVIRQISERLIMPAG